MLRASSGGVVTNIQSSDVPVDQNRSNSFPELSYQGRNAWWRYVLTFALLIVSTIVFVSAGFALFDVLGKGDVISRGLENPTVSQDLATKDALLVFVFLLWTIIVILIPFVLFVPLIHSRPLSTFIYVERFNWLGFRNSLFAWILVLGAFLAFGFIFDVGDVEFQFQAGRWLAFAIAAFILIPFQILAEEIVFRGYLLQMIARRTRFYLVRLLVPSCAFAALHFANQEVAAGGNWALACYFALAVYLGFLVLWGNGLEYALGLHLANNLYVALIASSPDSTFGTPTLFTEAASQWNASTLALTIAILCLHFAVLRLFQRSQPFLSTGRA